MVIFGELGEEKKCEVSIPINIAIAQRGCKLRTTEIIFQQFLQIINKNGTKVKYFHFDSGNRICH
jgi:hypothetical protein